MYTFCNIVNIQEIETKQRVYIRRSLAQFRAINQSCLGSHWQSSLKVPLLKHEMAIDKQ